MVANCEIVEATIARLNQLRHLPSKDNSRGLEDDQGVSNKEAQAAVIRGGDILEAVGGF